MLLALTLVAALTDPVEKPQVVVVVGKDGTPEYGRMFQAWAGKWEQVAKTAGARCTVIGTQPNEKQSDRERLEQMLQGLAKHSPGPVWLVLIGHGTYDRKYAKFNLRGPDVTAAELGQWLDPIKVPTAIINCSASSGPFINRLSAPQRVVISATKSGFEQNFARFGKYISEAIGEQAADLDKDEQVSLLEAFLFASGNVAEFYKQDARLATEHALVDDNGDGLGTPANWFRGVRATRRAKEGAEIDGLRANQFLLIRSSRERQMAPEVRQRRDAIELQLAALRERKTEMSEQDYYTALESLLVELAELYESAESSQRQEGS